MTRRLVGSLLLLAFLAGVAGCGSGPSGGSSGSADSFVRGLLSDVAHGEYGKYYDAIYPAQQKLASYDQYYKCTTAALLFAKAFGLDISSLKVERAAVRPGTQSVEVPGTAERVAAVAVTV